VTPPGIWNLIWKLLDVIGAILIADEMRFTLKEPASREAEVAFKPAEVNEPPPLSEYSMFEIVIGEGEKVQSGGGAIIPA
jgi:hypothetical protein